MVIGINAREYRVNCGLTLDQVSVAARGRGLKWSESRVADFEAGRVAPSLTTLLALALALNDAGCPQATLPGLVRYITPIQINDSLALFDVDVVRLLSGQPAAGPEPVETDADDPALLLGWKQTPFERKVAQHYEVDLAKVGRIAKSSGATEDRVRKSLGISTSLLTHLSAALWDKGFSQERDRRAGESANAQKRGRITREMQSELQAAIDAAQHGNNK